MEVLIIVIAGIIVLTLCTKVLKKNTNSTVITFKSTNGEIPDNMKEMMEKNFQSVFENAPEGFKDKFNLDPNQISNVTTTTTTTTTKYVNGEKTHHETTTTHKKYEPLTNCPNCGQPIDKKTPNCEYCGTLLQNNIYNEQ